MLDSNLLELERYSDFIFINPKDFNSLTCTVKSKLNLLIIFFHLSFKQAILYQIIQLVEEFK